MLPTYVRESDVPQGWFLHRFGDGLPLLISVTKDTVLGRSTCTSDRISKRHACITILDNNQLLLQDLNSTNGTYVNGKKVTSKGLVLEECDCITIGRVAPTSDKDYGFVLRFKDPVETLNDCSSSENVPELKINNLVEEHRQELETGDTKHGILEKDVLEEHKESSKTDLLDIKKEPQNGIPLQVINSSKSEDGLARNISDNPHLNRVESMMNLKLNCRVHLVPVQLPLIPNKTKDSCELTSVSNHPRKTEGSKNVVHYSKRKRTDSTCVVSSSTHPNETQDVEKISVPQVYEKLTPTIAAPYSQLDDFSKTNLSTYSDDGYDSDSTVYFVPYKGCQRSDHKDTSSDEPRVKKESVTCSKNKRKLDSRDTFVEKTRTLSNHRTVESNYKGKDKDNYSDNNPQLKPKTECNVTEVITLSDTDDDDDNQQKKHPTPFDDPRLPNYSEIVRPRSKSSLAGPEPSVHRDRKKNDYRLNSGNENTTNSRSYAGVSCNRTTPIIDTIPGAIKKLNEDHLAELCTKWRMRKISTIKPTAPLPFQRRRRSHQDDQSSHSTPRGKDAQWKQPERERALKDEMSSLPFNESQSRCKKLLYKKLNGSAGVGKPSSVNVREKVRKNYGYRVPIPGGGSDRKTGRNSSEYL